MKIVGMKSIDQRRGAWLIAAAAIVMACGMQPGLSTVQAEDADAKASEAPPADDPAEVQRRQQIKQQATHWEQQLTKLLYGDLELIRSICGDIPRASRRAIAQAGEQAVKDGAVQLAELQFGGPRRRREVAGGGIVIGGLGNLIVAGQKIVAGQPLAGGGQADAKKPDDPAALVSEALAKSLAHHLGREEAAAFAKQLTERSERRKAASVREIVAVLDGELFLTTRQRQQIERSLLEKWDDAMTLALEGMHWADDRRVFPGLPADCVSPHLTDAQRKRFAPQANGGRAAASQRQIWMNLNVLSNVQAAARDPWWFQ